ncbi:hypothetical protein UPYG_G00073980, partial [Umbra pygmaea]
PRLPGFTSLQDQSRSLLGLAQSVCYSFPTAEFAASVSSHLKMCVFFSVSRVLRLTLLTIVILSLTMEGHSRGIRPLSCCRGTSSNRPAQPITKCIIQNGGCAVKAYIFNSGGQLKCIDPKAKWLPNELASLETKGIKCVPLLV